MKKISDFKEYMERFVLKKHIDECIAGERTMVPLMHKIKFDKNGNNAMDVISEGYRIEEDEELIPIQG